MKWEELLHLIRAAGDVLGEDQVIIVGSQAILGQFPEGLPRQVTVSREADVMAINDPDGSKAMLLKRHRRIQPVPRPERLLRRRGGVGAGDLSPGLEGAG